MSYCFVKNTIVPTSEATLPIQDLAIHRGYAVFDFFRTYGGIPFHLEDHLDRFYRSAKALHLTIPISREAIKAAVDDLLHLSTTPDTSFKLFLTGGTSKDTFFPSEPTFFIYSTPYTAPILPSSIALETIAYERPIPHAKTIDYIPAIVALQETSADDLLYTSETHLFECTRANFFAIKDGHLITPSEGVLEGITRKVVLALSHLPTQTRPITLDEIPTFDEAFITSSTKQILPVHTIDAHTLPADRPHTTLLQNAFTAHTIQTPLTKVHQIGMTT